MRVGVAPRRARAPGPVSTSAHPKRPRYGASRDRDRHTLDASPTPSAKKPERTPRRIMSFSDKLSRWDVKVSPYLYISPFFILFVLVGLFPLAYTASSRSTNWDLVTRRASGSASSNYVWILTRSSSGSRCATPSASSCCRPSRS